MSLLPTVILSLSGMNAASGASFDPSDFLKQREFDHAEESPAVVQALVVVEGIVYRRFETDAGSIIIPKLDDLKPEDLERARCTTGADLPQTSIATVSATELKMLDKIRKYTQQIQSAVKKKCTGES